MAQSADLKQIDEIEESDDSGDATHSAMTRTVDVAQSVSESQNTPKNEIREKVLKD